MSVFEAIILGLIQGLTEFIPISSSGHLVIAQQIFGHGSDHLFIEFINIGTVLALIIFFRHRIINLLHQVFVKRNFRLARNILISAIPAGFLGFVFADFIENSSFFSSTWVVAFTLFVVGVLLVLLEKLPHCPDVKDGEALDKKRALGIGLAQALALIPGTSRSGSTIIAGRIAGLNAAQAAEYSFLLSIPIMLGVIAKLLVKDTDRAYLIANIEPLLLANVVALLSGLLAVGFLMRYLAKHSLAVFGWYRIILAVVVATVLLLQ